MDQDGRGWMHEQLRVWLPMLLLVLSVRTYAVEPYRIPSGSMAPVLAIGDQIIVDKLSYGLWVPATGVDLPFADTVWVAPRLELVDWGNPQRGDIVVFRWPKDESQTFIKRVVGLPGDRIEVKDNQVSLDGVAQPKVYLDRTPYVDDKCRSEPSRRHLEDLGGVEHEMLTSGVRTGPLADWPATGGPVVVPDDTVFVMGDNRDNSADSRSWGFVRYDQIKGKAHAVWYSWDPCAARTRGDRFMRSLYR